VLAALIFSSPHILWLTHITGWTRYLPGSLTHGWRLDCEKGSQRAVGTYFNAALLTNIISMVCTSSSACKCPVPSWCTSGLAGEEHVI
jgi:hypothetical protein